MTSLSDLNQRKSKWSLEPGLQGTRQECGRFQDQKAPRTLDLEPAMQNPLIKEQQSHQKSKTSQKQECYFDRSQSERQEVEEQTRAQHKSDRWHQERKYKLTSSHFGEICKRRKYDLKYCESLSTNQKDLSHIPAVKFGLNQEKVALEQFKQRMRFDVVKKAGFFISKAYPHLGARPDGIVPASELNDEALVEVKCSYANRFSGEPPNYLYKVASHFKLRRGHKYYYQIQGQLHCTGLEMCYLVVYTFPRLFIVRVYKDSNFCNRHMIPKLNQFYYQYFKPLIVDKHGVGVRL